MWHAIFSFVVEDLNKSLIVLVPRLSGFSLIVDEVILSGIIVDVFPHKRNPSGDDKKHPFGRSSYEAPDLNLGHIFELTMLMEIFHHSNCSFGLTLRVGFNYNTASASINGNSHENPFFTIQQTIQRTRAT